MYKYIIRTSRDRDSCEFTENQKNYADSAKFSFPMKIQTQLYLQIARYITWEFVGISCSCFLLIPVKSAKINRVRVSLMRNDNQYPEDGAT